MALLRSMFGHLGAEKPARPRTVDQPRGDNAVSYKLVPIISQDYCTGCAKCVSACEHDCLAMVWDFPKLQRAADCHSDGACVNACPEECIQLDWAPATGDRRLGCWRDNSDPA
jgi:NAD-dependent dihydropyrimidine dehydrogenase PreA subunit